MKKIPLTVFCLSAFAFIRAQSLSNEVIGSSGNHFTSAGYALSWTLGEPVTETFTGPNYILTQGFHQPEINLSGIPDQPYEGELSAYPVPTEGIVNINFHNLPRGEYRLALYDLQGRELSNSIIMIGTDQYLHTMDISHLAGATYLVSVQSPAAGVNKTFRVIRTSNY